MVMMYIQYQLSLRNVEDLLAERGIDISHETVRFWWNRFGPMFAAEEFRKRRAAHMRGFIPVALAFGRGVREDQRQALLSLARRRSQRRGIGGCGSQRGGTRLRRSQLLKRIMKRNWGLLAASSPTGFVPIPQR